MKLKNDYGLLPHIKEPIYGLNPNSAQLIGWQINTFDVSAEWRYSKGENVVVGVIDTGCDLDHPDIKNNLLSGKNLVDTSKDPIDDNGHGSHVAGTIAAEDNGLGVVGVAPKAKIIPIKALDHNGSGSSINIAKGIVFAADNKCDFICMSLGSSQESIDILNAIKYAITKGCIIFCAAGNAGENSPITYPAKHKETIAIGSIDRRLCRSNFTCCGEELDFLSPGQDIVSCIPDNSYALMSGTSMATPYAVGCACLALSYAKHHGLSNKLKNKDQYIELFRKSVRPLSDNRYFGSKKYQGYGILYPTHSL